MAENETTVVCPKAYGLLVINAIDTHIIGKLKGHYNLDVLEARCTSTERIVSIVREDAPDVSFLCIANEQGLFQSLTAQRVEKILEVTTTSMIAAEYFNRERRIRFAESIGKSLGLDLGFLGHTGEWQAKEITLKYLWTMS